MAQKKYVRSNEIPIQTLILEFLARKGILAWRNQQIPVPIRKENKIVGFRRADQHTKGLPDIFVVISGHFIGLEVKDKGKQEPEQIKWEKDLKKHGASYYVVHSLDEAIEVINLCYKSVILPTLQKSKK